MAKTRKGSRRADVERGLRDITPIVLATVPFGLVFGTIAPHEGLPFGHGVFLSAAIFAGASQFAALELWTHPLPFFAIIFSVSAVNLRLLLYSAAIGRRIGHWPAWARFVGLGLNTDPVFALAELRGGAPLSAAYYFALAVPVYLNWIVTTAAGYVFGGLIGDPKVFGLDFVVIAYFICILMGFRKRSNALAVVATSATASLIAYLSVGPPWHFAAGAVFGMGAAILLAHPKGEGA